MANVNEFYFGSDWEQTSGPIVSRQVPSSDLWFHGLGSKKNAANADVLADGLHPILAIGRIADRSILTQCGVVISFNLTALLAQVNIAHGFVCRQYVSNILTYGGGNPATFAATYNIGALVYLDDSDDLSAGVTLSLSPLNSAGEANPFVGELFPAQDEYVDDLIGGPNHTAIWPVAANAGGKVETLLTVMLK